MIQRRYHKRKYKLHGISMHIVLLFTLAPLFAVLGRQAKKERMGCVEYSTYSLGETIASLRDDSCTPKRKTTVHPVTTVVLRIDEKGAIHWFERDSERFIFSREHHDRCRRYFRRFASRIYRDSTRIFLVEMKCHPATTYGDVLYILETGWLSYTHIYSTEYNIPKTFSDTYIRVAEPEDFPRLFICGTYLMNRYPSCRPKLSFPAQLYSNLMEYLGFSPEMYQHNIALFQ